MKKLLSTGYTDTAFNIATFMLRATLGILMFFNHGLSKLNKFGDLQHSFFDPMHIGHRWSLLLVLFAEIACSLLMVLGLFSRLAAFVLFIDMMVAVFVFSKGQPVSQYELAIVFLVGFFATLLVGPGRYSVDGMTGK